MGCGASLGPGGEGSNLLLKSRRPLMCRTPRRERATKINFLRDSTLISVRRDVPPAFFRAGHGLGVGHVRMRTSGHGTGAVGATRETSVMCVRAENGAGEQPAAPGAPRAPRSGLRRPRERGTTHTSTTPY